MHKTTQLSPFTAAVVRIILVGAVVFPYCASAQDSDPHAGHDHAATAIGALCSDHDDHGDHAGHADVTTAQQRDVADDHAGHNHAGAGDEFCSEHNMFEREDALCQADHITDLSCGDGMLVRLFDTEVAAKIGITTQQPLALERGATMRFPGQVAFNRNRLAQITPLSRGVVREVHVRPGSQVEKGQVLVTLAMPELAELIAELLSASAQAEQQHSRVEREERLYHQGITAQRDLQQARADQQSAHSNVNKYRQQLNNFGLSNHEIDAVLEHRHPATLVRLRAPFAGTVTALTTARGEHVTAESSLLTVADLDHLWLELSVPEAQIQSLDAGAAITATFRGLPNQTFSGELFHIGTLIDNRSRTLTALAEVANPEHRLRAGMYGEVELTSAATTTGEVAICADAIQMIDNLPFVFVAQPQQDLYEVRRVVTGARTGTLLAVAGVTLTDAVVVTQGYALKSEVLKARLGASCADH